MVKKSKVSVYQYQIENVNCLIRKLIEFDASSIRNQQSAYYNDILKWFGGFVDLMSYFCLISG